MPRFRLLSPGGRESAGRRLPPLGEGQGWGTLRRRRAALASSSPPDPRRIRPRRLKPFKDELFAYPAILSEADGGAYRVVDYQEMRDINGRDEVPERRVQGKYVSLGVRKVQKDLVLKSDVGTIRHVAVGRLEGASAITIYLHGQGGSRKQGVDDFTFGGNFNRIKNLMAENGGLYLSPDFSDFGDGGAGQVAALIDHYAESVAGRRKNLRRLRLDGRRPVLEARRRQGHGAKLGGLLLLGSLWDDGFLSSPAFRARVPVFFGQGSRDTVFPGRSAGGVLPLDPREGAGLSGALRALRDRHARHADPHDRLARDAELDAVGRESGPSSADGRSRSRFRRLISRIVRVEGRSTSYLHQREFRPSRKIQVPTSIVPTPRHFEQA